MSSPSEPRDARAPGPAEYQPILTPLVGWLVGADSAGAPLVDFAGNPSGPCAARRTVPLEPEQLHRAAQTRQEVLLTFERGNPRLPIITGLLLSDTPRLDALLDAPAEQPAPVEANVDGQRVVIEGKDEIVLKCGQASITLRRNGKLIIKGAYVETHSTGLNRIKGGSVQIN